MFDKTRLLDEDAMAAYVDQRIAARHAASKRPLARGTSFEITLSPPTAPSTLGAARHLSPALSCVFGISATWYLHLPLQSGWDMYSQVWLASISPPDADDGSNSINNMEAENYVVLKIFQESVRPGLNINSPMHEILRFRPKEELVSRAIQAYKIMEDFQGSTLPYFFGSSTATAPSGEEISMLAFEYLPGPTLESFGEHLALPEFAKWNSWEGFEPLARSVVDTMAVAHERGIFHRDLGNLLNFIIDIDNNRLVIIDWEFCEITDEDDNLYKVSDEVRIISTLISAGNSMDGAKSWVYSVYPQYEEPKSREPVLKRD